MSAPPVMSGAIPADGPVAVLRAIERRATSGVLRFSGPGGEAGELALRRGQVGEADEASRTALERFLGLAAGRFEVHQRLPALPVSRGDDEAREGRLGVHGVVDLLQYCETAGLTGALFVTRDDQHADFLYDAGELVAVRVFGDGGADVQTALGWDEGAFRIEAWSAMPALPEPSAERAIAPADLGRAARDPETENLLKVVEVTLSSLLDERAAPPPPAEPRAEPRAPRAEPRAPRADATVRVIYLGAPGAARRTKTAPPLARPEPERAPEPEPALERAKTEPALERAKTEPDALRSDPTLLSAEPPFTAAPERAPGRPTTASYLREAGVTATLALALSALLFLAAIASPFVLE